MPYLTNYLLRFQCAPQGTLGLNSTLALEIEDTQSGEAIEPNFFELRGAADALTLETENNDEDKFSQIRAKKLTIRFNSNTSFDLNTFTGDDDRYRVHLYVEETSQTLFKGFLVLDDMREPYLPKPNAVTLVATDHVGLLKDVALTKTDGTNPRGKYSLIQYIAWCLQKTGLQLDIMVGNNLQEVHDPELPIYRSQYLDAKTFEQEVGTSEDCYTVLEKILGESCFLTQESGAWYIMRVDEYEWADQHFRLHRFDYEGTFVETWANTVLDMEVGTGKEMKFSQEATEVGLIRPQKFVKETYNFTYPLEIIDNIDFDRGELRPTPEQTIGTYTHTNDDGSTEDRYGLKYYLEDWTAYRRYSDMSTSGTEDIDFYIRRDFDTDDSEAERYVVVTPPASSASPWHHIESNPVPMGKKDKFTLSFDFRFTENITGSGGVSYDVGHIRLQGEDGTTWTCDQNGYWHQAPGHRELGTSWAREDLDETDWQHYEIEVNPIPVAGDLYFALYAANLGAANGYNGDVHFQNLRLEIKHHINGSYLKNKGQYTKVEQDAGLRSNRSNIVNVSDSPRKLFKGALMWRQVVEVLGIEFISYHLSSQFWNGGVPSYWQDPPADGIHSYGHLQAYDVWNQQNRVMRVFEATIQGLQLNVSCPGLTHRYKFTDSSVHNAGKFFVLLHCSMDFYTGEWTGTFAEVFDTTIGKEYESAKEFKYISDRG